MICNNYPVFYQSQAKRKKQQLLILSIIFGFLFLGLVIIILGYSELSKQGSKLSTEIRGIVNTAYAKVDNVHVDEDNILVDVIVPIVDIKPRTKITNNLITRKKIPSEYVGDVVRNPFQVVGLYSNDTLYAGQAIDVSKVSKNLPMNKIIDKIPVGYRAVTITLSPTKAVEGWLQAGTSVDVYWISNTKGGSRIVPIVQNAYVISADRVTVDDRQIAEKEGKEMAPIPVTASLLVTQDDALKIGLASTYGELTLSLRGDEEKGISSYQEKGITTRDLLHKNADNKLKSNKPVLRIVDKKGKVQKYYFENDRLVPIA